MSAAARSFSPQLRVLGPGSGIGISSARFGTGAKRSVCRLRFSLSALCEAYRTLFCWPLPLRCEVWGSSRLTRTRPASGSSSASWSTRSPVSLQSEKSDRSSSSLSSSVYEPERRRRWRSPYFSSTLSLLRRCERRAEEPRVCRGMLAGLRVLLLPMLNGILAVVGAVADPLPRWRWWWW